MKDEVKAIEPFFHPSEAVGFVPLHFPKFSNYPEWLRV
jgi:hypothetical protein